MDVDEEAALAVLNALDARIAERRLALLACNPGQKAHHLTALSRLQRLRGGSEQYLERLRDRRREPQGSAPTPLRSGERQR